MSDIYDDENLHVVQGSEIGDSGPGVFAPDAHRLAVTHHHDADYGLPDTTVTVGVDSSGLPLSCSYGGRSYGSGETVVVPAAVAAFWVRSGWATTELDATVVAQPEAEPDSDVQPESGPEPEAEPDGQPEPVKPPTRGRSTAAGSGRRKS